MCNCTQASPGCEIGSGIFDTIIALYLEIRKPEFPKRPVKERDAVLDAHTQAVQNYIKHIYGGNY